MTMSDSDSDTLTIGELLPDDFVDEYTEFNSTDELLTEAGLVADTPAHDHTLAGSEFDRFVEARSHFNGWPEMRDTAMDRHEQGGV